MIRSVDSICDSIRFADSIKSSLQALLAQAQVMKFGFVSRADFRKIDQHVILATEQFKPVDYAQTISLDMQNSGGAFCARISRRI